MDENQRIYVSVARIEEKLEHILERLDKIQEDNKKCQEDHEERIRDLEKTSQTLSGKLIAIYAGLSTGVAAFVAWFTQAGIR